MAHIFPLGSTDPSSVPDQGPTTSSFSISPSRSLLHQSLFISFARAVPDDSDIASSASCAVLEEADIASSVSSAREDGQEREEELSKAPENDLLLLTAPSLATSLLVPFHLPILPTCACVVQVPMLLLSSALPALPPSEQPKLLKCSTSSLSARQCLSSTKRRHHQCPRVPTCS